MKFLLLPLLAFAAPEQFHMQSKLFIDGKLMSSPAIVVNNGKEAMISSSSNGSKMSLKMTPTKSSDGKILVKLHVEYLSGHRTIRSAQTVALTEGQEMNLNLGEQSTLNLLLQEQ